MKKIFLILFLLCGSLAAQTYQFESAADGGTFYWSLTGEALKSDSLRVIQGSNMTITQDGNTLTFAGASGAGSTANVRANTGWTNNGTTAQDTLATYYLINGKYQRLILVDTDNDSIIVAPHSLFPLAGKDETSLLFAFDSTGRLGLNALTSAQATRAFLNVLGRAASDTMAIFSNDGGGVVGDSTIIMTALGGASFSSSINMSVNGIYQIGGISAMLRSGSHLVVGSGTVNNGISGNVGLGSYFNSPTAGRWQAVANVRAGSVSSDTLFMVRNDWNATLDSTFLIMPNGDVKITANNLYLGANRIRSVTGDTSFVFYSGTTQIFAILADGTTAGLVAGTPPTSRRYIPPPDYIWLLRVGVLLLLLLVAFKVHNYLKPFISKHKTLPGEI